MALRVPYLPPRLSTVLVMPRPRTRKRLIVRDLLPGVINVMHIEGPVEGREAHAVFGKPAGCNHMGRLKKIAPSRQPNAFAVARLYFPGPADHQDRFAVAMPMHGNKTIAS